MRLHRNSVESFRQKLIDRLTDVAFAAAFWGAPVKSGYLASTVYKDEGKVGAGGFVCGCC